MGAKVIAGDYEGYKINVLKNRMYIDYIEINKETVANFEVMNENSNTISFTKGNTKKSMIGAGTKGAVGAAIGTAIAPGIGTLIGAGAGVVTSKGKTKSVTKEIITKEIVIAIYFNNGEQSLVKMDGEYYEKFLSSVFSGPFSNKTIAPKMIKPKTNSGTIVWLIFFYPVGLYRIWKYNQFSKKTRIIITAAFVIATIALGSK